MVDCLAFSPDGKALAGGSYDHMIHLWEVDTGKKLRSFTVMPAACWQSPFRRMGKTLVSGSWDQTIRIWDMHTGQDAVPTAGHQHEVRVVATSPDSEASPRRVLIKRYASGMLPRGEKAHVSAATPIGVAGRLFSDGRPVGDRGERSYRLLLGDR